MKLDSSQIESIIDDDLVPSVDTEALDVLLSNISNRLKGITGKSDWKTSPEISIDGIIAGLTDTDSIDLNYDATFKLITASVKDGWLSTNAIRNQNASAQTGNFWISGSGKASSFTSTADSYFNSVRIGQGFTSGNNNIVLGYNIGTNITSSDIIAIGRGTMGSGIGGYTNIGIGLNALYSASGDYNIAIGGLSMQQTTTGNKNLAFGYQSLFSNTTGSSNIAIGYFTLNVNTTGGDNIAIGASNTLTANTIGGGNIGLGSSALASNISGSLNMALGSAALAGNTTGSGNVAIGPYALRLNTTGDSNIGIGQYAGWNNATGIRNVSIGEGAGYNNTGASTNYNTFIGYHSGYTNSGSGNVALGYNSGVQLSGSQNLYLGYYSGDTISSGNFNVVIGTYNLPSSSQSNSLAIADGYGNIKIYSPDTHNIILGGTTDNTLAKLQVYGALYINTIANATTDTNKFIVSDSGVLKYRTGAEVLSDIDGLSTSVAASTYVALGGSYVNPTWITSLAWSKISSTPTTLAGYGITDSTSSSRTLTMTGASNRILINGATTAQTFDLSANRTWTFTLPQDIATTSDVQFGKLGLGNTSSKLIGSLNMQLLVESTTTNRGIGIISNSPDGGASILYFVKSRGTIVNGVTAVQSGDQLFSLTAFGTDGTGISSVASTSIAGFVDGTVSTGIVPAYMNFRTATSGGVLTEAMRITSAQLVLIGRTLNGSGEQFQVQGTSKFFSDVNLSSTVTIGGISTINAAMNFSSLGSIVMAGGTGTETGINMNNRNIVGINRMEFFDSGPNEGILWSGGNLWSIYDSPNDITTNTTGNIQFVQNGVRKATINTSGQLELPVSTGTAPLVISSTTKVSNLNADLLDSYDSSEFVKVSETQNITGLKTFTAALKISVTAGGYVLTLDSAGTNSLLQKFSNTGGNAYVGIASSTGGGLLGSATTAYAFGIVTESAKNIVLGTNNIARLTVDGTTGGVTLSSTLSVTGAATFSSNLFIGGYLKQNTLNTDLRISANGTGFLSLNYDGGSGGVRISDGGGSNVIFSVTTTDGIFANPINTSSTAGTAFLVNASGYIKSRTASQVLSDIGAAAVSGGSGYIQNRALSGTRQTATFDISGDSRIDGKIYIGTNGAYLESVLIAGNYRIRAVDDNGNKYVI